MNTTLSIRLPLIRRRKAKPNSRLRSLFKKREPLTEKQREKLQLEKAVARAVHCATKNNIKKASELAAEKFGENETGHKCVKKSLENQRENNPPLASVTINSFIYTGIAWAAAFFGGSVVFLYNNVIGSGNSIVDITGTAVACVGMLIVTLKGIRTENRKNARHIIARAEERHSDPFYNPNLRQ